MDLVFQKLKSSKLLLEMEREWIIIWKKIISNLEFIDFFLMVKSFHKHLDIWTKEGE
jgi:hypothetical protein